MTSSEYFQAVARRSNDVVKLLMLSVKWKKANPCKIIIALIVYLFKNWLKSLKNERGAV